MREETLNSESFSVTATSAVYIPSPSHIVCGLRQDEDSVRLKLSASWATDLAVAIQAKLPRSVKSNAKR